MGARLSLPAILAFAFLLAFAGCGGGGDDDSTVSAPVETTETAVLTKEELISQGDAICAEVNAAVGTVGSTSSGAAGQAAQVAGLYAGMVDRLTGLGAPAEDSAGYSSFIAAAEGLAQAQGDVQLASERGEEEEALTAAETEASSALASFQAEADSFGFEQCGEAPAAPTVSVPGGEAPAGEEAPEAAEGEVEEAAPEEVEAAPEAGGAGAVEEESAGGGATAGGGTEGGGGESGGSSGGIGPG